MARTDHTVGIDIGTSSVKAALVDAAGEIVARARVPHAFGVPSPRRFEHDPDVAWRSGVLDALAALDPGTPAAVSVAAMVPSLAAVDASGAARTPGLLYGDERGDLAGDGAAVGTPAVSGELTRFLAWAATEAPDAAGYWPAQAVANHALAGEAVVSTTVAATAHPLFDWTGWDPDLAAAAGVRVDQLPRIVPSGRPAGEVAAAGGAILEAGTIDALGEQIVAGADELGDVLVVCGTTLIVWVVIDEPVDLPGYFCVPHTSAGHYLLGGPSDAGGLFLDWAARLVGGVAADVADPAAVPVWAPYPRGERVPFHDPHRRAGLVDLDLTHGPGALRRAAFEAAGFVTRRMIEAAPVEARRLVATGGGTRVPAWIGALADATGLPVDVAASPEGGARGAAWFARMAAGLESGTDGAARWARTGARVEPDPAWTGPVAERYRRFGEIAGAASPLP